MSNIKPPSDYLLEHIKIYEGFSSVPYRDIAGYKTIGYGHRILPGESFTTITYAEAFELLRSDVLKIQSQFASAVRVDLPQNKSDAITDFAYNLGARALIDSTLLKYINFGQFGMAADEFPKWDMAGGKEAPGLLRRRLWEKELFIGS